MPVEVDSRFPQIVAAADEGARHDVSETTDDIAEGARHHLVLQGSVDSSALFDSVEGHSENFEGEASAGLGLPDARAVYVELGTGVRGAEADFPGKPAGITYDMSWTKGIPKNRPTFAYLIPALEEQREPFEIAASEWYR